MYLKHMYSDENTHWSLIYHCSQVQHILPNLWSRNIVAFWDNLLTFYCAASWLQTCIYGNDILVYQIKLPAGGVSVITLNFVNTYMLKLSHILHGTQAKYSMYYICIFFIEKQTQL